LILDEPTANLDPLTEKQVLDTLFRRHERQNIPADHTPAGRAGNVDEILVMEAGKIVERGRHRPKSLPPSLGVAKSNSQEGIPCTAEHLLDTTMQPIKQDIRWMRPNNGTNGYDHLLSTLKVLLEKH
jgi:energy-coupling factor transporter ATP-binding protein EcfA2